MKVGGKLLVLVMVVLAASLVAAGCGQGSGGSESAEQNKTLTLGYIEWDENVAVSNLTKVLLEEELGYEKVELTLGDVGTVFQGVGSGDLAAFQDVWMPGHKNYLSKIEDDAELLEPWFEGETEYGIAVLDYMEGVETIGDLKKTSLDKITGIEPGAAFHKRIKEVVIPQYDLDMTLTESSTPAMLAEVKRAYQDKEPIAFLAWSPHWMNAEYPIRYLKDPKDAQGSFDDPMRVTTIVNKSLPDEDPVAYAFMKAISLDAEDVNQMEAEIQEAGDPIEGVKKWLEENREVVEPWIETAEKARET